MKQILARCGLGLFVLGCIALIVLAGTMVVSFIQNFDLHLFLWFVAALIVCYIIGLVLEWWWGRGAENL